MTDHDLLITVATQLEGIKTTLTGKGGVCEQLADHEDRLEKQGGRLTTVETYWKVAVGILVVLIPTVVGVVLVIL